MIIEKTGKHTSVRTDDEEFGVLAEVYLSMPPDEREAFDFMIEHGGDRCDPDDPDSPTIGDMLIGAQYDDLPPSPREYCEDAHHGKVISEELFKPLREDFIEIFTGDYHEVILTGSLGHGKTFLMAFCLTYMIRLVLSLRDPQKAYGISGGSKVMFGIASVSMEQVKGSVLAEMGEMFQRIPWFQNKVKVRLSAGVIEFPKNVEIRLASGNTNRLIGQNVLGAAIDEGNFMKEKKGGMNAGPVVSGAESLYTSTRRRMESRFMRYGRLPGVIFLASSKFHAASFVERRVQTLKEHPDPRVMVRDRTTWEVAPERYSAAMFQIFTGDEMSPGHIIENPEQLARLSEEQREDCVLDVPVDFKGAFEQNFEGALTDTAGVAIPTVSVFIRNRKGIADMWAPSLRNAVNGYEVISGDQIDFRWGEIAKRKKVRYGGYTEDEWQPRLNPEAIRYAHIDPSLNDDKTGLCIGHIDRFVEVQRPSPDDPTKMIKEVAPLILFDLILRIVAPAGGEINFGYVRSILYEMMSHGFKIGRMTIDTWQSVDYRQMMRDRGVKADPLSMDLTWEPYRVARQALDEGRVRAPFNWTLEAELAHLRSINDKRKIDHPDQMVWFPPETPRDQRHKGRKVELPGSKDVADAWGGVIYSLSTNPPRATVAPRTTGDVSSGESKRDDTWAFGEKIPVDSQGQPTQSKEERPAGLAPFLAGGGDEDGERWI